MELLDPYDDQTKLASLAELDRSAKIWADRGALNASLLLHDTILTKDLDHVESRLAKVRAHDDGDDTWYRRLDAKGQLTPEAYEVWFNALFEANRLMQACYVAGRFRTLFAGDVSCLALAAFWLAECGELVDAQELVEECLTAPAGVTELDDATATRLIDTLGVIAKHDGVGSPRRDEAQLEAGILVDHGDRRACFAAAQLAMEFEEFKTASGYLERLEHLDQARGYTANDTLAVQAKLLRARVAIRSNVNSEAVEIFRALVQIESPEWSDRIDEWRVDLAGALYAAGHVVEAGEIAKSVIKTTSTAGKVRNDEIEWRVRAQLIRVQAEYDSGRFAESWQAAKLVVQESGNSALTRPIRAELLRLRCRLRRNKAREILPEFDELRASDRWATEDGRAIELTRLETLAWLADHADPSLDFRSEAEVALGDTLAMFRNTKHRYGDAFRAGYVALLAGKDQLAWHLLRAEKPRKDWRAMAIKARAALGTGNAGEAYDLYESVLELCGHSLDLRCGFVEAALQTDQKDRMDVAMREAYALVRFVPNFVQARILLAECLSAADRKNRVRAEEQDKSAAETAPPPIGSRAKAKAKADAEADAKAEAKADAQFEAKADAKAPLLLIEAVHEYATAFRLHDALEAYLSDHGSDTAEESIDSRPLGSDLIATETLKNAARMGAHAAIRASMALARAHLPQDKVVRKEGYALIKRVKKGDRQEGKRLGKLLRRPRSAGGKTWGLKFGLPIIALASIVLLHLFDSNPDDPIMPSDVRAVVLGLLVAVAVWPSVRSVTLPGGFGITKVDVVAPAEDEDILVTRSIRGRRELCDLGRLPQPSDIHANRQTPTTKHDAAEAVAPVRERACFQAHKGGAYSQAVRVPHPHDPDTN